MFLELSIGFLSSVWQGVNPDIRFEVIGGTDFDITPEGFILMVKEVSTGTVNLQVRTYGLAQT